MRARPSRTTLIVLAGTFMSLTLLLVLVFGEWLRHAFVVPALYFFWLFSKIVNSIDQQIFWTGLTIIALFALIQVYLYTPRQPFSLPDEGNQTHSHGRVHYWLVHVNLMIKGVYHRSYFSEDLKRLILSVLAMHERQLPIEIERRITSGDLHVPPQVKAFFISPRILPARKVPEKILFKIHNLIHPETRENQPVKIEDFRSVIAYLEDQLEKK